MTFPMTPDPIIQRITAAVKAIEAMADELFLLTDGAPESYDASERIEGALREVSNDLVLLNQLRVPDQDAPCETCGHELLWDSNERMNYCPNTWEHG